MIGTIFSKVGAFGIVSALIVATLGVTIWIKSTAIAGLERELEESRNEKSQLMADVAIHHAEISELELVIYKQNDAISDMRANVDARKKALEVANKAVIKIREDSQIDIARLSLAHGSSCEEGIDLLDLELGL